MVDINKLLKEYYGYDSFRKSQEEIINNILSGKDVLAIMPTGGGKSICYQIPAIVLDGVTIVISPLISLMKDQVDNIKELGIKAAYINSTIDNMQIKDILYRASNGDIKILYVAPERLQSSEFMIEISKIKVSQVAVDEAHCVSQWGHDFRTSYRYINKFISLFNERPTITAFTATATIEVKEDIINLLGLDNPKVFLSGFDRENLTLNVLKGINKDRYLNTFLDQNRGLSGIIYCSTRKEVEKVYSKILEKGHSVSKYHGGLGIEERTRNQEDFVYDRVNIIVATNAFGMGIDKPDIRFVVHYNMPQSIESYYQEIGRAGRDGEKSECVLLFAPGDIQILRFLIESSIENPERRMNSYKKLQAMTDYVYSNDCYRSYILRYFGEDSNSNCANCSNCTSEGEIIDKTIDAQKVMSCIYKMKRGFGTTMIIDVLRGSKNSKLRSFNFDTLSTYGIMKDYSKDDLKEFINTLIASGYLDLKEGEFPIVALNNRSVNIIKGDEKVLFKTVQKAKEIFRHNELFEELKAIRNEIAMDEHLPPYMIFGDASLLEMSNRYPTNNDEFLDISGVGELKLNKYGGVFIEKIKQYKTNNNVTASFVYKTSNNNKSTEKNKAELNVNTNLELLDKLCELRLELSKKRNQVPSSVVHVNTLKEISGRYPNNLDELKDITGLGPKKISEFGNEIIHVVKEYKSNNNINTIFEFKEKAKVIVDGERRKSNEIALDKLREGESLESISKEIEYSISTIMGYITDFISEGNSVDFTLDYSNYIKEDLHEIIMEVVKEIGYEKISLIKKKLPDYVQYENIRASILKEIYKI